MRLFAWLVGCILVVTATTVAAGCGSSTRPASAPLPATSTPSTRPPATPTTSTGATTTGATVAPTTTAAPYAPTTPQASPDAAATALIKAWSTASRTGAAAIASPGAIASLFAVPYPGDALQSRNCSEGFSPATCTFHDGNALIQLIATKVASGWYVSSVVVEN